MVPRSDVQMARSRECERQLYEMAQEMHPSCAIWLNESFDLKAYVDLIIFGITTDVKVNTIQNRDSDLVTINTDDVRDRRSSQRFAFFRDVGDYVGWMSRHEILVRANNPNDPGVVENVHASYCLIDVAILSPGLWVE